MARSNFEILGVDEGATPAQVREAFRRLALEHHSDRGGEDERFKIIKQAYEDLKRGKKYPAGAQAGTPEGTGLRPGETEADAQRRNAELARQISARMEEAQEWLDGLEREGSPGTRVFGSGTGELEIERNPAGTVILKGGYMAGPLSCPGQIHVRGSVTSPSWSPERSVLRAGGDFRMASPVSNRYRVDNGARILSETGSIVAGNVSGRRLRVPDPDGRVGVYTVRELLTELVAPAGKVIVENASGAVLLEADTVILLNAEDGVRVRGRHVMVYGGSVTHDVRFELKRGGTIRFYEEASVQGISDDALIVPEDSEPVRLYEVKTKRISDVTGGPKSDGTMVGGGFVITYEMLSGLGGKKRGLFGRFRK